MHDTTDVLVNHAAIDNEGATKEQAKQPAI